MLCLQQQLLLEVRDNSWLTQSTNQMSGQMFFLHVVALVHTAAVPLTGPNAGPAGTNAGGLSEMPCRSDRDCINPGTACGDAAATVLNCTCSAEDGSDLCERLGTCQDFCSLPSVVAQLAATNAQVLECDPFLPNTCTGTLVCQPSSQCVRLACTPGSGALSTVRCAGVCLPVVREPLGARFSDAGDAVLLALNAPALGGRFRCAAAFGAAAALLEAAWCEVADQELVMKLPPGHMLRPGDVLSLSPGQRALVDKLQDTAAFVGNVTIARCRSCVPPTTAVVAPSVRKLLLLSGNSAMH
jgi:hypothetical protein